MSKERKDWSEQYRIVYDFFKSKAFSLGARPTTVGFREYLGISSGKWANWSKGQWPSAEDLEQLHDLFGFSYSWLITGKGDPFAEEMAKPPVAPQTDTQDALSTIATLTQQLAASLDENRHLREELAAYRERVVEKDTFVPAAIARL